MRGEKVHNPALFPHLPSVSASVCNLLPFAEVTVSEVPSPSKTIGRLSHLDFFDKEILINSSAPSFLDGFEGQSTTNVVDFCK